MLGVVQSTYYRNIVKRWQPLDRRNGQVFFLKFTYGNNKGKIHAGDNMLTSQQGFNGGNYSGVKPGTMVLTSASDLAVELKDVPNADGVTGTFTDTASTGLGAGTINYVTGALSLTGMTKTDVELAYEYDQNSFDAPVDEVDVRVVSEPVVARPRKLKSVNYYERCYKTSNIKAA